MQAEQAETIEPIAEELTGLELYRALKKQANELGIEIPKGTDADEIKRLIEKAGEK